MEHARLNAFIQFSQTIKGKLLLACWALFVVLLLPIVGLLSVRMYVQLKGDAVQNLRLSVEKAASEIDKSNQECVQLARTMALAQESALFGKREETIRFVKAVAAAHPKNFDAYVLYEPDADGQDHRYMGKTFEKSGRFTCSINNVNGRLEPVASVGMDTNSYYQGPKQKFLTQASNLSVITEPYIYEGVMMVEHTYPIAMNGRFVGVAGVDRTLDAISTYLGDLKPYPSADFMLVSQEGGIIAATNDPNLRTQKITETPWKGILASLLEQRESGEVLSFVDPGKKSKFLYGAARIPTGEWTLVMRVAQQEILAPIQKALWQVLGVSLAGFGLMLMVLLWISRWIANPIQTAAQAAARVAAGDLTHHVEQGGHDEMGSFLGSIQTMTSNLNGLIRQVQKTVAELTSATSQMSASARALESYLVSFADHSGRVTGRAQGITDNAQNLARHVTELTDSVQGTAQRAEKGRTELDKMERRLHKLENSSRAVSSRFTLIREKAELIGKVTLAITKISEQTHLLSLNAAIEAEKAGEAAQGFGVVAREMGRLADQTSVAALQIEQMIRQMQHSVLEGASGMDQLSQDMDQSLLETAGLQSGLENLVLEVQQLYPKLFQVNEGMQVQSLSAGQIGQAMVELDQTARQALDSAHEFNQVAAHLRESARLLVEEISHFQVESNTDDSSDHKRSGSSQEYLIQDTPRKGISHQDLA